MELVTGRGKNSAEHQHSTGGHQLLMKKNKSKNDDNDNDHNPLLTKQQRYLESVSPNERENLFSLELVSPERRGELWMEQADLGEELVNQYSWATPDERALRILKHLSPVVEIGCGANAYWCRVMTQAGVDVVGYDGNPQGGGKIQNQKSSKRKRQPSFRVRQGGPEVLARDEMKNRTLFVCYVDEEPPEEQDGEDSMTLGAACLEHYQGDYVVHVGELYGDTLSMDQAPWGRSSGPEFQQRLASEYHCLLRAKLTNWLHVRDTISVWKRTERCSIVFAEEDDREQQDGEEEEVEYRHIPVEERLPTDVAAPCLQHLLTAASPAKTESGDKSLGSSKAEASKEGNEPEARFEGATADKQELNKTRQPSTERDSKTGPRKKKKKKDKKRRLTADEYECPW